MIFSAINRKKQTFSKPPFSKFSFSKNQGGASLIEVMVSLLILGVGLLGVLSLQSKGINSNQRAVFVTEAQLLAQDMADRIMAYGNIPTGDLSGGYVSDTSTPPSTTPSCTTGCTAAEARDYDKARWGNLVGQSSLPRARGQVTWAGAAFTYTIRVLWDQEREGGTGTVSTCNTDNCYQMELKLR